MPRDASGNYTLPAGNPVITGTIIASGWANPTMGDLAQAMTDSLDRNGNGGMLAPFRFLSGAEALPALAFTADILTGRYLADIGDQRDVVAGQDVVRYQEALVTILTALSVMGDITSTGVINAEVNLQEAGVNLADKYEPIISPPLDLGTAAYLNAQASLLDTTADRLMLTGAFGLGADDATAPLIDLDSNRKTGMFRYDSGDTASPSGGVGIILQLGRAVSSNGTLGQAQIAIDSDGEMFVRLIKGSVWTPWSTLWSSLNSLSTIYHTTAAAALAASQIDSGVSLHVAPE